jgi:hypothetical protein
MGCIESKNQVVQVDRGVQRDASATVSHLRGKQSLTYTFSDGQVPTNYSYPQITITGDYNIGVHSRRMCSILNKISLSHIIEFQNAI